MLVATQYLQVSEVDELELEEDYNILVFKYNEFISEKAWHSNVVTSKEVQVFEDRTLRGSTSLIQELIDYLKTRQDVKNALIVGPFTDEELTALWHAGIPVGDYKYNILPFEPLVELSTSYSVADNISKFIESSESVVSKYGIKSDLPRCAQQISGKLRGELAKWGRIKNYKIY